MTNKIYNIIEPKVFSERSLIKYIKSAKFKIGTLKCCKNNAYKRIELARCVICKSKFIRRSKNKAFNKSSIRKVGAKTCNSKCSRKLVYFNQCRIKRNDNKRVNNEK